jgi:hypothetical protein
MSDNARKQTLLIHKPRLRLAALANRPGGISREKAIADAEESLADMRGAASDAMDAAVGELEDLCSRCAPDGHYSANEVLRLADCVITAASTCSSANIAHVAMRLCDVVSALGRQSIHDLDAISVHIRAMRLLLSSTQGLSPDAVNEVMRELDKVADHFGATAHEDGEDWFAEYEKQASAN